MRALDVPDKAERVARYQKSVVAEAMQVVASMGLRGPHELAPHMLRRRVDQHRVESYAELYEHLEHGQLLADVPPSWRLDWELADPDRFHP